MQTIQTAINVGSVAAQVVVPARLPSSNNLALRDLGNIGRVYFEIQSYGPPDYSANPTFWVAFGKAAVVGGSGSFQMVVGAVFSWSDYECPQGYISIISESGTALGMITESLA